MLPAAVANPGHLAISAGEKRSGALRSEEAPRWTHFSRHERLYLSYKSARFLVPTILSSKKALEATHCTSYPQQQRQAHLNSLSLTILHWHKHRCIDTSCTSVHKTRPGRNAHSSCLQPNEPSSRNTHHAKASCRRNKSKQQPALSAAAASDEHCVPFLAAVEQCARFFILFEVRVSDKNIIRCNSKQQQQQQQFSTGFFLTERPRDDDNVIMSTAQSSVDKQRFQAVEAWQPKQAEAARNFGW